MRSLIGQFKTRSLAIVFAQATCLVLGFWIYGRIVVSSVEWNAKNDAWAELTTNSMDWIQPVRRLSAANLSAKPADRRAAKKLLGEVESVLQPGILVVDAERRVVLSRGSATRNAEFEWEAGQQIAWSIASTSTAHRETPTRGTLLTPAGPRLGLAYPLQDGTGFAVVFRTEATLHRTESEALGVLSSAGAIAFIWTFGLQCVVAFLYFSRINIVRSQQQTQSKADALKRTQDLVRTRDAVIFGLAKLADSRDPETGEHLERISLYATRLASALRRHPKYRDIIDAGFMRLIGISSALHDIGKVGISDSILLKPGPLTAEERTTMQGHTSIGGDCLKEIEQRLGTSNFLQMAREIALAHHERWDGAGYPLKLSGIQIPVAARIVAVADVYDALSSKRVYKPAMPHSECVDLIRSDAGKHFDADIIGVFLQIEQQFREIAAMYASPCTVESTRSPESSRSDQRLLEKINTQIEDSLNEAGSGSAETAASESEDSPTSGSTEPEYAANHAAG